MKYLNAVLTVIASCLLLITFAVTGIIPSANANDNPSRTVTVPINPDGTITVKLAAGEVADVNLREVGGRDTNGKIDVNIKEVGGSTTYGKVDVNIKEVDGNFINRSVPVKISN